MHFTQAYDLVVAGGGLAGVAAALVGARAGWRTALVEKTVFTGGLATTGLIFAYLPLCDGNGTKVTFGLNDELFALSLRYGPGNLPTGWVDGKRVSGTGRYSGIFSPAAFILALDEALTEAGVEIWFDTLVCGVQMDGRRLTGLEVENKSGRGLLTGACFVDATGDADVAFRAGAPCVEGSNWLSLWAFEHTLDAAREAIEREEASPLLRCRMLGVNWNDTERHFCGVNGKEVSAYLLLSRQMLRDQYKKLQAQHGAESRKQCYPITLPAMAQFRRTRRIEGMATLVDHQHTTPFTDSIGLVADWRTAGYVWEIPYGTLLPQNVDGLLVAGRCISADGDAWEVTRVIPSAVLTGEAAGLAAVLALANRTTPDQIPPAAIQRELTHRGIPYHIREVLPVEA